MAPALKTIDVTDLPELRRVAEDVRETQEPLLLRTGNDDVAILVPIEVSERSDERVRTQADHEAFLSAFGGWKGIVETEKLKAGIRAGRSSDRPPVEL